MCIKDETGRWGTQIALCNSRRLLADFVNGRRIGLRFFSPQAVGGRGAALFNMWDCFIVLISVRDCLNGSSIKLM
jgi:hypothetical protein